MGSSKEYVICRDIYGKKERVPISKLSFRPSVYGVIIRGNKVLLSRQFDGYDFPGGAIERGETIDVALVREVWEETGLRVTPGPLLGVFESFFTWPNTRRYYHSFLFYYLCTSPHGKISAKNFSAFEKCYAKEAEWVLVAKIKQLKFYNPIDSPALIRKAMKGRS